MPMWRETLAAFLKDKKPAEYESLQASKSLEKRLDELEQEAQDLFNDQMASLARQEPLPSDFLARARRLNSHKSIATEVVLAQMTEMPIESSA